MEIVIINVKMEQIVSRVYAHVLITTMLVVLQIQLVAYAQYVQDLLQVVATAHAHVPIHLHNVHPELNQVLLVQHAEQANNANCLMVSINVYVAVEILLVQLVVQAHVQIADSSHVSVTLLGIYADVAPLHRVVLIAFNVLQDTLIVGRVIQVLVVLKPVYHVISMVIVVLINVK